MKRDRFNRPPWQGYGRGQDPVEAPLWYWMAERQAIYFRRLKCEPKPWTDDPILQQYRFCNVFRELDTVTQWIRDHIRIPYDDHEHLWFMLAIARYINHPPTLTELIITPRAWPDHPQFDPGEMTVVLNARKARGEQIYTGAYMIRAESDPKAPWFSWSKQSYIAEIVLGRLWEARDELRPKIEAATTLEHTWELLAKDKRFVGWGPFMAYEWVTDLRWTRYLNEAKDKLTWANAGPGALRGLRRLASPDGSIQPGSLTPEAALAKMRLLLTKSKTYLPPSFGGLELRDIEHSLCETDKYLRVWRGEGKPRSRFNGT